MQSLERGRMERLLSPQDQVFLIINDSTVTRLGFMKLDFSLEECTLVSVSLFCLFSGFVNGIPNYTQVACFEFLRRRMFNAESSGIGNRSV